MMFLLIFWLLLGLKCLKSDPMTGYIDPSDISAYEAYNIAVKFARRNEMTSAIEQYLIAISLKSDLTEAYQNLGVIYDDLGDTLSSLYYHQKAIESIIGDHPVIKAAIMTNLASSLLKSRKNNDSIVDEAVNILKEAVILNPTSENIVFTLGSAYFNSRQFDLANQTFSYLLQLNPNNGLANLNIGNNLFRLHRFAEASRWYKRAVETMPVDDTVNQITALSNMGQCIREMGDYPQSLETFDRAMTYVNTSQLKPLDVWIINNMFALMTIASHWKNYEQLENLLMKNFHRAGLYEKDSESLLDLYTFSLQRYVSLEIDKQAALVGCANSLVDPKMNISRPSLSSLEDMKSLSNEIALNKLSIGYISYDWRNHPMGRLTKRLVLAHNKSTINTFLFSYGLNDGSRIRKDIEKHAEQFFDILNYNTNKEAAEFIRSFQLDILVDITSHTYNGRIDIAARHPADIIINYLGYPGSTGCAGFDYTMIDPRCLPAEYASFFTEKLIYLPNSYQANSMPLDSEPCLEVVDTFDSSSMSTEKSLRIPPLESNYCKRKINGEKVEDFNKSSEKYWICSFNANKKIEPVAFSVWMNILRRLPNSNLFLLNDNVHIIENFFQEMSYHGISLSRLLHFPMINWKLHLDRITSCDIVIDTFVYGAHTTASDMLWMYVPIVSLEAYGSGRMPSRVASGITRSLFNPSSDEFIEDFNDIKEKSEKSNSNDLSDLLVVNTLKEYEDIIFNLLQNKKLMYRIRNSIAKMSLLSNNFDSARMQALIERSYMSAFEIKTLSRLPTIISSKVDSKMNIIITNFYSSKKIEQNITPIALETIIYLLNTVKNLLYYSLNARDADEDYQYYFFDKLKATSGRLLLSYPKIIISKEILHLLSFSEMNIIKSQNFIQSSCNLKSKILFNFYDKNSFKLIQDLPFLFTSSEGFEDDYNKKILYGYLPTSYIYLHYLESFLEFECYVSDLQNVQNSQNNSRNFICSFDLTDQLGIFKVPTDLDIKAKFWASLYFNITNCIYYNEYLIVFDIIFKLQSYFSAMNLYTEEDILLSLAIRLLYENNNHFFSGANDDPIINFVGQNLDIINLSNNNNNNNNNISSYEYIKLSSKLNSIENPEIISLASKILHQHAVTYSSNPEKIMESYFLIFSAYSIAPSSLIMKDLGIVIQNLGIYEIGFKILSEAVFNLHYDSHVNYESLSSSSTTTTSALQEEKDNSVMLDNTVNDEVKVKRIVFYCYEYGNEYWPRWGPSSVDKDIEGNAGGSNRIGGSEEAMIYLARALSLQLSQINSGSGSDSGSGMHSDYRVEVYADPLDEDLGVDSSGVHWYNHKQYDPYKPVEIFVSWRYPISTILAQRAKRVYVWLHDLLGPEAFYDGYQDKIDGILVQSEFHRSHLPLYLQGKAYVLDHGLDKLYHNLNSDSDLAIISNQNHRFVYASSPSRGLETILLFWGRIKLHMPDAVLDVYYGFTSNVDYQLGKTITNYSEWKQKMLELLEQEGVVYHGMVGHRELSQAFSSAGFILYPTKFPETGCLTIMKAMASGAIPITSRYTGSVLYKLTDGFDLGPTGPLFDSGQYSRWVPTWLESVLDVKNIDPNYLNDLRYRMKYHIRKKYSWDSTSLSFINSTGIDL